MANNRKTKKIFLKQLGELYENEYEVVKTVDAGTEFAIGSTLNAKKVDTLAYSNRYSVTIS